MRISTKGRYAIRVMIDIAEHNTGEFIPLMDIAKRQEISEKYLESIVAVLSKNSFLISLRGKGGGYKLAKSPDQYTIGSILKLTESSLAPVACLDEKPNSCMRVMECPTIKLWEGLEKVIDEYLEGFTIADLVQEDQGINNYVI
ncbi:MAG: Rrf2 family transcriptional regulator [Lachnospiraceae bacterium]|nr:Rrf2 family transcriptional regulator [Lachnospiraceae bacterium]